MMEFQALRVSTLTEEIAGNLEGMLSTLPGVENFDIMVDTQELRIRFDEDRLDFQTLAREMARVGCSLRDIDAALLL